MQDIIKAQGAWPWTWYLFANPFTFVAFFVFFVSALAEGNRTPFDLPEAESELVAGFATEYSGMRNLLFFMAEWGNLYVIGAIVTTLFLGGWHIPFTFGNPIVQHGLEFATFFLKAYGVGVLVPIWLRWTLPRIRVDQMMTMCWKYLVPIAFVNLLGAAAWMLWVPWGVQYVTTGTLFVASVAGILMFLRRVVWHLEYAKLGREHLSFNPLGTARSPG
jgi:NADH-quinone oxidoreductase subunit H